MWSTAALWIASSNVVLQPHYREGRDRKVIVSGNSAVSILLSQYRQHK
jgi:hypothetical protein